MQVDAIVATGSAATVTETRAFLFTDIEASTSRWERGQDEMAVDLARHDELLRAAVQAHGGRVVAHTGDGFCAAFSISAAALHAALDSQRALRAQRWSGSEELRVRMAVHVGAAQVRDDNYFGPTLNRTARLMALAAGGQVLCSAVTAELARDGLPAGCALRDLGEHRLADLARPEGVFQLAHPDLPGEFPPLRFAASSPHNLPDGLGVFLGRDVELAELANLVGVERLVTLWGTGGAGKTRLSLELGARVLDKFGDGVWFVELAPLDRADLVAPAVMAALGMSAAGARDPVADLVLYLKTRQSLLILDNCEHLLAPVAQLAHAVLQRCPGVRMLASSRELLAVPGERAWAIPPLSLPPHDADAAAAEASDAVGLFCERAASSRPGFALTAENRATIVEICRRLDGIPLALELAAARVRALGVNGVAARLDDRFGVLTGGSRTAETRHQTLRAAVDWSYDLLDADERELLHRLSVFPASFELAAAEAVGACAGDVPDLLARLVDKSLVIGVEDERGDVRYRLLETIRQYGADRLDAARLTDATRRRHLDHFLGAPVANLIAYLSWDNRWLLEAERERDNFRAALDWATEIGDADAAIRLAGGLWVHWMFADAPDLVARLQRTLAMPGLPRNAAAVSAMGGLAMFTGDRQLALRAIDLADSLPDTRLQALIRYFAGQVGSAIGDADLRRQTEASLALAQSVDFTYCAAFGHFALAWQALAAGDPPTALEHADRGLALCPPDGAPEVRAHHLATVALASALIGDVGRAELLADEVLAATRSTTLSSIQAMGLARASAAATLSHRWPRAEGLLRELLLLLRRQGTGRWLGDALECTALALEATGRLAGAAQMLDAAQRRRRQAGEILGGSVQAITVAMDSCRQRLSYGADATAPGKATSSATVEDDVLLALHALDAEPDALPARG